ncbi:MAG TPA: hypothetical protein VHX39_32875, partial [Acetobacteraceae bacterium]|nr:hypothetical protein [Acetobacteraceae bacterium]
MTSKNFMCDAKVGEREMWGLSVPDVVTESGRPLLMKSSDPHGGALMHPFQDFCRRTLHDIRVAGRYRSFTALRKVATRFPVYVRPDGTEVLIWS